MSLIISSVEINNMHSPSNKSGTTNEAGRSPETSASESPSSSPVKNASKLPSKELVVEQTPTRFLAACSKHDLEPNPFEQSFSGANPLSESTGTNSPKPSLPPVAQLESPSAGISANEEQYGWSLQSLRTGPLSPSILTGPQESMMFDGRTGTTPLPFGSFTDASPGTAALFGAIATSTSSATSFMNSIPAMATTDPFNRNVFTQGVPKPLTDSERKTISTNSGATVSGVPTSQSGVVQPSVSATNMLGMTNGSMAAMATNPLVHTIMPKTEKDDFTQSSSNPIVVLNNVTHTNGISSNISSQHKGSVITSQSMDHDSSRSASSSPIKSPRNARRKAEDNLISEQPPVKKNGQKSKSDMTDEEKRRNFLERNRQAALKCRQRKKQWLANLQAKVEYLTNDNETLQSQAQSLREEILNLKTLLLAHKDCPIAQANGVMGLDTIPPNVGGMPPNMSGMNVGHTMNVNVGMTMQGTNAGMPNVQGTMGMSQVPPHMSNHVNGPPGSGMNNSY
ncbi:unnamed protein product [Rhizophagus irregularis]|nr:unnamed protein product [Rhizophagus irregularis]